ncbi:MAG: polysaccharide deacetylase family protein, partial [Clostridia bacterium]|nr:polysaccharide deacetylase family protein [Clostridia bacterium]
KLISETANRNEIKNCNDLVYKLTGYKMTLFAPPSGSFSNATLKVASELNMSTIMWSKDTIDWRDNDKSIIISRATSGVNSGDLILMHPKEHTLAVMQDIIDKIKGNGLELLTVSECAMLSTVVV